ncbi:MAG: hypothetical protein Q9166_001792 [cf. Caloplaca sp. 2 TL-2023]
MHSRAQDVFEAKQMVRKFSWKAYSEHSDDDLVQSLVVATATDTQKEEVEGTLERQWGELFDSSTGEKSNQSQEEIILASSTDELAKSYKAFQKCLPKGHVSRIEDGPPRFKAVYEAVATADSAWKKNRERTNVGRMKTLFGKVCGSLENHRTLFAVIPSGDKYISLVAGSISAIVKATVNHDKIAEAVSTALDDLSDDARYWRETLEVYRGHARIREYIARLYVVIFKFLVNIMTKWMKSSVTRFMRSFESDFLKDEIEAKKSEIRDLERKFEREGSLATQKIMTHAPTKEDIAAIVSESQARFQLEWLLEIEQLKRDLGQTMKHTLQDEFLSSLWTQRNEIYSDPSLPIPRLREASMVSGAHGHPAASYLKRQILLTARRRLQQNSQQEHVSTLVAQSQDLSVHIEIFDRIQRWNAASGPQLLWIQGPFQAPIPSRYTILNTYVLATAQRASVPALSYFCDRDTDMVQMIYSLILQIIELIPDDFHSDLDFTSARFEMLDGTDESLTDAIDLLKDLLAVGPYLVFMLIDGLQRLDRATNAGPMDKLLEVLCSVGRGECRSISRTVKVLLTTDGIVEALMSLRLDERLDVLDFTGEDDGSVEVDGMELGFL